MGDVEYDLLRLRVVRVLNKFQGHHVVALESGEVASDVAEKVRGVRTALPGLGCLVHSRS